MAWASYFLDEEEELAKPAFETFFLMHPPPFVFLLKE
jgi:hypothetical protein